MHRLHRPADGAKLQQVERALRDMQSRYQLIVETGTEGIWTLDAGHKTDYINPRGAAILGYPPAEILGRSPLEFLYPEDAAEGAPELDPRAQRLAIERDLRFARKDGTPCWVHMSSNSVFDEQGMWRGAIIMFSDITERKQAEARAEFQASLLANVHDSIVATDANLNITSWNHGAEELYGWQEAQVLGQNLLELARTRISKAERVKLKRVLNEHGHAQGAFQEYDKQGNAIWVEGSLMALRDAQGLITGYVVVNRNITKRKRAEDALLASEDKYRQLSAELEQRVRERTAALEQTNRELSNEIVERKRAEEQIEQQVKDLNLIAHAGLALLRMGPDDNIFEFIGSKVKALVGDAMVAVNSYDPHSRQVAVRGFFGSPEELALVTKLLGTDPVGVSIAAAEMDRAKPVSGVLARVPGGLYELSLSQIPLEVCQRLERALNVKAVYSTQFAAGDDLLGTVAIFTHTVEPLPRASAITAFLNQAGVAVQRQRAEQALRISEERYRRLVELSPDGVSTHRAGKVEYINPAGLRMFGATDPDQVVGRPLLDFVHPDCRHIVQERVKSMIHDRAVAPLIEEKFVRLDGTAFDVEVAAVAVGAPSDQTVQVVYRDITDRKQVERALKQVLDALQRSELRLQIALDSANVGIYEWNTVTGELDWDDRLRTLWGLEPGAPTNYETFLNGVHPEDRARVSAAINQALDPAGSGKLAFEYRVVRSKDKTEHWIASTGQVFFEDRLPVRTIGAAMDVTDYKLAEQRIRQLNQDLERHAAELQLANKELESFSYSVSHDLRSPLASIDGFSRLVIREYGSLLPADGQRFLGLIHENSKAMMILIEDLLTFSRFIRQPIKKQPVKIDEMVRRVLDELRGAQIGRQIDTVLGPLPPAHADPVLLKQVWVNLISNALKFTRTRDVTRIEIGSLPSGEFRFRDAALSPDAGQSDTPPSRGGSESSHPKSVIYYVRDNGIGFDMERASKLFGVFQRLHSTDEYEGTGVGLAIVERVVRRHGGRLWAQAEVNNGATFYFTLGPDGENPGS